MNEIYMLFLLSIIIISGLSDTEPIESFAGSQHDGEPPNFVEMNPNQIRGAISELRKNMEENNNLQVHLLSTVGGPNTGQNITTRNKIQSLEAERSQKMFELQQKVATASLINPKMKENKKLFGKINSELGKVNKHFAFTEDKKFENMKMAEINNYYNDRSKAYVKFFKFLFYCMIPILILALLINRNIIPTLYGNILLGIFIFFILIWGGSRYYDLISRNNMNFNEYDYDSDFNIDEVNLGSGDASTPVGCFNEHCCNDGTEYNEEEGICEVIP